VLDYTQHCYLIKAYFGPMDDQLGASMEIEPKTMSNSGENYEHFYICFFLDILKL
jgi:hypothetical protein